MNFHPFAEQYPLMPDAELALLTASMKKHGFDARFPIDRYDGKILDGRNRYLAATKAGVEPEYIDFEGDDDEAQAFVIRANEDRRHLAPEWLKQHRAERIKRVVDARADGKSIRTIAKEENVSPGQVQRDLNDAEKVTPTPGVSPPDTPEPKTAKTTGKDGKTYPATKPPKPEPVRCKRCTNMHPNGGSIPNCPQCAEAKANAKPSKPTKPPKSGSVKFDDRKVTDMLGKLARLLNDRAQALGLQRSKGWADIRERLDNVIHSWDRWQLELEKK